ncbi:MAG: ATP-dependent helicase [Planctomycetes bacterium]|nr:ATP-dependent helicase [Planctomycetota bacterium]
MTGGPREEYELRPAGGASRIDYAAELNPQQLEVAMAGGGPLLVIAGAGSGKTRTLTYRVARLVETGVPPGAILLLTFTNKASSEMLARAETLLGGAVSAVGGTFHHAGHLALRRHGHVVGLPRNFTIADRDDAEDLLGECMEEQAAATDKRFPKPQVVLDMISMAANTLEPMKEVVTRRYPMHLDLLQELETWQGTYAARKMDLGIVDFDDLLTLWLRAMDQDAEVRSEFQRRFAYVMVDEYQDTNLLQAKIVDHLAAAHRNLMVVGDDAQSIYSFRGANFANIIKFNERYPDAKMFKLEINYRSSPEILALANASIEHNSQQYAKKLVSEQPPGPLPKLVPLERPDEQAAYLAQRIRDLENEGIDLDQIAVLYRSHYLSMELQLELSRRGIPFEIRSGIRFFEQAHIKDASSYLRIAANPMDELAWKRALRLLPKVGKATAAKIWAAVSKSKDPLGELSKKKLPAPKAAAAGMEDLARTMQAVLAQKDKPSAQLEAVLAGGFRTLLHDTYENANSRILDLETLAAYATRFQDTSQFLAELALYSNAVEPDTTGLPPERRLVLSTIHQAKGLEWQAVFVPWLVEGRFPDARALGEGSDEEERRLFYVAVTRARRHLELTYPLFAREGQYPSLRQRPSRFIEELPSRLVMLVHVNRAWGPAPRPEADVDPDDTDRWMDGKSPYDE